MHGFKTLISTIAPADIPAAEGVINQNLTRAFHMAGIRPRTGLPYLNSGRSFST